MSGFNIGVALAGGTVLALGLVAGYVKNRLWIAESTICLVLGIIVGPAVLGLLDFSKLPVDPFLVLKEAARVTLGISVMAAALRLPAGYNLRHFRALAILLGPGLLLMWLASFGLAWLFIGGPLLVVLAIGAALVPTDPVVAGAIASGGLADRLLPARIRDLLTAESGANDGLALLFVMLPVLLLEHGTGEAMGEWLTRVLLWEILGAVAMGFAAGWVAGRLLCWARRQPYSETQSTVTIGLALSITVLAIVRLIGSDGILAVFVAGAVLNRSLPESLERHEEMQHAVGRFFDLPVFILIGAMLPWSAWFESRLDGTGTGCGACLFSGACHGGSR